MFIRNELFANPKIVAMSDLTSHFVTAMRTCGIDQVKESSKKHLRRKLESVFGQALHIFSDEKGKLFLYPDNLSITALAQSNIALTTELQSLKSLTHNNAITTAALKIRADLEQHEFPQAWPPHIAEGEENAFNFPESVTLFLQHLLAGSKGYDSRTQRLTTSFSSDLLYAVTHGKKKPPKHILLPFAVKCLTGNVELIKTLNRLGHCVSYSQMEEIDASKTGSQAVIVTAEDTDVMIICLAFSRNIQCSLYQKCGTKNRTRFIDITKLSNFLGSDISEALIGLHAFTGCDTVSAFAGHGKLKALKLLKKNKDYMEIFSKLGESWELSVEL